MDVRIGVTYTPKEIDLDLGDDADAAKLRSEIEQALANESGVLWLTDKKGKQVGIPSSKIAYIEVGAPGGERRVGFAGG